jgi:hypothetical protein
MINFPTNPTLNSVYTVGNKSWFWDGVAWNKKPATGLPPIASHANHVLQVNEGESDIEWTDPPELVAGQNILIFIDEDANTVTLEASVPTARTYSIPFWFTGISDTEQMMLIHVFAETVVFADNFTGSQYSVGTNPSGAVVFDIQKQSSGFGPFTSIGSMTFNTSGSVTFVTTGSTITFASGDVMRIVSQQVVDAELANTAITLKGSTQ